MFFKSGMDLAVNTINIVILAVSVLVYIGIFLVFFVDSDSFDQFRYSFRPEAFAMLYYWLYVPAIILTVLLVALVNLTWPCLIPMGCLLIFVIIYRPYRNIK